MPSPRWPESALAVATNGRLWISHQCFLKHSMECSGRTLMQSTQGTLDNEPQPSPTFRISLLLPNVQIRSIMVGPALRANGAQAANGKMPAACAVEQTQTHIRACHTKTLPAVTLLRAANPRSTGTNAGMCGSGRQGVLVRCWHLG